LAGLLVDLLKAPVAILADAISFLGSALFIFRIQKAERSPRREAATRGRMRHELAEGLRYVLTHAYLKNIAACTALFNFFGNVGFAVLLVFARRELELSPAEIGLAFMLGNVGPLLAAFSANRLSQRLGVGPTIIGAAVTGGPMFLLVPFAPHGSAAIPFFAAVFVVGGFCNVVYNVAQLSLRQAITPERIQGRMNSVMRFIVWGTIPLGALVGGLLTTTALGLKGTLIVGGIGTSLSFVPVLLSPVRSLREMPEAVEEEPVLEPLAVTVPRPGT
jgi:MFS family permease